MQRTHFPRRLTRRAFLGGGLVLVGSGLIGSAAIPRPAPSRFEFSEPQMGLPFRIVLYAPDEPAARRAAGLAFARIAELNHLLSDYEDHSELTRLSRSSATGAWVAVSEDLWRVLACGQEIARRSDGAFDMTVGPVVQLWRRARRQRELPPPERLAEVRRAVGWRWLELDHARRQVRLAVNGMRLDLGGIAKGYAAQEAVRLLTSRGITSALVSGGGDLATSEPPPDKAGWRVALAPLDAPTAPPARFVRLRRRGLATSGDVFQFVEIGGVRYSHIVDPRTGVGLTVHSLVTVIARDGMTADALATAVSVLGPERGLRLVRSEPGAEAQTVLQTANGFAARETPGLKKFLEPETAEAGR